MHDFMPLDVESAFKSFTNNDRRDVGFKGAASELYKGCFFPAGRKNRAETGPSWTGLSPRPAFPDVLQDQGRHKPKRPLSSPWTSHVLTCVAMKIRAILWFKQSSFLAFDDENLRVIGRCGGTSIAPPGGQESGSN